MRNLFHIHVDAEFIAPDLARLLVDRHRFALDNFSENADGSVSYAPDRHISWKSRSARAFKHCFETVQSLIARHGGFKGYLEGEFIAADIDLPPDSRPFDPSQPIPFEITCASNTARVVRESEIHITIPVGRSDPRLRTSLRRMGFFLATLEKSYGPAEIFTVQSTRRWIAELFPLALAYLQTSGGHGGASIKEERIARWWISGDDVELPPLIDSVRYSQSAQPPAAFADT